MQQRGILHEFNHWVARMPEDVAADPVASRVRRLVENDDITTRVQNVLSEKPSLCDLVRGFFVCIWANLCRDVNAALRYNE